VNDLTPPSPEEEIRRGHEAQAILDNTEFQAVMEELLNEQKNRFLMSAPEDSGERDDAHMMVRALQRIHGRLAHIAESGTLARIKQEEEALHSASESRMEFDSPNERRALDQ